MNTQIALSLIGPVLALALTVVTGRKATGYAVLIVVVLTTPALRNGAALGPSDFTIAGLLAISLAGPRVKGMPEPIRAYAGYAIVSLSCGLAHVLLLTPALGAVSLVEYSGPFLHLGFGIAVLRLLRQRRISQVTVVSAVVSTMVIQAVIGLWQFADVFGMRSAAEALTGTDIYQKGEQRGLVRAGGTFYSWHALGSLSFIVGILCIWVILRASRRNRPVRRTSWIGLGAAVVGLAVTLTFALAAVFAVAAIHLARRTGRLPKLALLLSVLGVVSVMLLSEQIDERLRVQELASARGDSILPATLAVRWELWTEDLGPHIRKSPLLGVGPVIPEEARVPYSESMYVDLLLKGGVILLVAFLVFSLRALHSLSTSGRGPDTIIVRPLRVSLVGLLTASLIHPYFSDQGVPYLLLCLLAVSSAEMDLWRSLAPDKKTLVLGYAR